MRLFFHRYLDLPILPQSHPLQKWIVLAIILLITEAALFDSVGVAIATPDIQGYYKLGITETDWINTSYLMMLATTVPVSARFGTQCGFKFSFFVGCLLFFIANLFICFSPSFELLIFWRCIAGAGAGILMPQSISILALAFDRKSLPFALSMYTALGFGAGFALGSLLGGFYSQEHSFQWIFFIIFFVGIFSLLGVLFFFHETEARKIARLDIAGYLTFLTIVFSALLLTMNVKAPWNTQGWYSFYAITHAVIILASFIAFLYIESTASDPLFLLRHFTIRPFLLSAISMFCLGGIVFGTPVFFAQILHADLLWPSLKVGEHFTAFGIAMGISGAITGILSNYTGIRWPSAVGLILITISCFMNHNFTLYSTHIDLYNILIVRGIGVGVALGPITSLGLLRIPRESRVELAKATVMLTILRQMGAAFASNIFGIIITQREQFHLLRFGEMVSKQSAAYKSVTSALQNVFSSIPGTQEKMSDYRSFQEIVFLIQRQAHIAAFDDAFFAAGVILAIVTIVLIFLMLRRYVLFKLKKLTI